jgi:cobalamin synthase
VNAQWRLFLAALRYVIPGPNATVVDIVPPAATRFVPLAAMVLGSMSGGLYWLAAAVWPTSVALVLSMLAGELATGSLKQGGGFWVFGLLIKYNALMALSAAGVPIPLPEHVPLGLIMVAGYAVSRALAVSVQPAPTAAAARGTAADLGLALVLGLAPATLLGIPGLTGLAAAIAVRLTLGAYVLPKLPAELPPRLDLAQQATEIGFYLGALATWTYI